LQSYDSEITGRGKKPFALLQKQKHQIDLQKAKAEQALEELRVTQTQLIQSENGFTG